MSIRVSYSDKIVVSIKFINRLDNSNSSNIVTFCTVSNVSNFHLVNSVYSSSLKIKFNSILDLNFLSKEFKSSSIMSSEIADFIWSNEFLLNSAEFEIFLLTFKRDLFESSFNVIKNSVGFVEFWNINNVHKTTWVFRISSNLLIYNEKSLFLMKNSVNFSSIKSNSKFVS